MKKYNATLLYVGDAERERYKVNVTGSGLEKIYSAKGTDIYRLGDLICPAYKSDWISSVFRSKPVNHKPLFPLLSN